MRRALALACALACAVLLHPCAAQGGGDAGDEKPYFSREECITNGEELLGDISFLLEDQDAVSCAVGPGEACCRALGKYFGKDSNFYGCPCYQDLFAEAIKNVPAFARPLVEQRFVECGIPTPSNGCRNVTVGGNATDQAVEPNLGQSSSMMQYSAPWSFTMKGFDAYGKWHPCQTLDDAQYCVSLVTPPNLYSEIKWGACLPAALNESAITAAIVATNPEHYATQTTRTDCSLLQHLPHMDAGAIAVTTLLLALGATVVAASLFGLFARTWESFPRGGVLSDVVAAFDAKTNWDVLMSAPRVEENGIDLRSLNGLLALSMFWIILGKVELPPPIRSLLTHPLLSHCMLRPLADTHTHARTRSCSPSPPPPRLSYFFFACLRSILQATR